MLLLLLLRLTRESVFVVSFLFGIAANDRVFDSVVSRAESWSIREGEECSRIAHSENVALNLVLNWVDNRRRFVLLNPVVCCCSSCCLLLKEESGGLSCRFLFFPLSGDVFCVSALLWSVVVCVFGLLKVGVFGLCLCLAFFSPGERAKTEDFIFDSVCNARVMWWRRWDDGHVPICFFRRECIVLKKKVYRSGAKWVMEKKANMFPDGRVIDLHRHWRSGNGQRGEELVSRKNERKKTDFLEQSEW